MIQTKDANAQDASLKTNKKQFLLIKAVNKKAKIAKNRSKSLSRRNANKKCCNHRQKMMQVSKTPLNPLNQTEELQTTRGS